MDLQRLSAHGGLERGGVEVSVEVDGPLIVGDQDMMGDVGTAAGIDQAVSRGFNPSAIMEKQCRR
jgi:hypothetical protein